MARLFVLLLLATLLIGYDQNRLNMNAKVFEKILLLDTDLSQKAALRKAVGVTIFYDEAELLDAQRFGHFLETISQEDGFPYPLKIALAPYSAFEKNASEAYFLFDSADESLVNTVASHAIAEGIITFSYNYTYLEHGVMLSLRIDQKVYPLINPEAIKQSKINFKPILIRIAKQYKR